MTTIVYSRHVFLLLLASVALMLLFASPVLDSIPVGDACFVLYFGLLGALHAICVCTSLRRCPTSRSWVAFVSFAGIWSVLTPFSPLLIVFLMPGLHRLGDSAGLGVALAFGSAFGASGYWLLVRRFWLKFLTPVDWITTVVLCAAATVLSFFEAGVLSPKARNIADLLPTLGWWIAFSLSLYWSEVRGKKGKSLVGTATA
jgi:drug/metabolite transporter (DMT)-like permease